MRDRFYDEPDLLTEMEKAEYAREYYEDVRAEKAYWKRIDDEVACIPWPILEEKNER